jgi:hypothetical protein
MVCIFSLYGGLNQISIDVCLSVLCFNLSDFVLHFDFICGSVSRFKQMQTETVLICT